MTMRVLIVDCSRVDIVIEKIYSAFLDILSDDIVKTCFGCEIQDVYDSSFKLIILVWPSDRQIDLVLSYTSLNLDVKVIVIGPACSSLITILGLVSVSRSETSVLSLEASCHGKYFSESDASVCYLYKSCSYEPVLAKRPALRSDYDLEWNNWGYGYIWPKPQIGHMCTWAECTKCSDIVFGLMFDEVLIPLISFVSLSSRDILWINRDIGVSDLPEWSFIEHYISSSEYGWAFPIKAEQPYGLNLATYRLDCDESICSSSSLISLYRQYSINGSLAVTTNILGRSEIQFLFSFLSLGGSVLSHSHSHPYDMGRSYPKAYAEAVLSRIKLEDALGLSVSGFVAPFHHLPTCAARAVVDAGYRYVIGALSTRHSYNVSFRAGSLSSSLGYRVVFHNQQLMLHGAIANLRDSFSRLTRVFDFKRSSSSIISYLDHPFSSRYDYGWGSEIQRLRYHEKIIEELLGRGYLFVTLDKLAEFLAARRDLKIGNFDSSFFGFARSSCASMSSMCPSLLFNGKYIPVETSSIPMGSL